MTVRNSEKNIRSFITMTISEKRFDQLSNNKDLISIRMKIILNYLQIIAIVNSFEFKWPYETRIFFNYLSILGNGLANQSISFDCLVDEYDIKYQGFYVKTFFISLMPLLIILIFGFVLIVFYLVNKRSQKIRFIITIIVTGVFTQSSIIKALFEHLPCKTIENQEYLAQNMKVLCNSEAHLNWVIFLKIHIVKFFLKNRNIIL